MSPSAKSGEMVTSNLAVAWGARLAVETGMWPLKEAIHAEVTHTYIPKLRPVEDYLRTQAGFHHLFEPTRQEEALRHIQEGVSAYWDSVGHSNK